MPVTLAQAKLNTQDDIKAGVIDEFRKSSFILDNIPFDEAVTPGTAGATLTYGYQRVSTQATAAFRAINSEYTPGEAQKVRVTVDLKPFGGSYQVDRVIANTKGLVDEVTFQAGQKIKAAKALFHDAFINGDSAVDANSFDGLNKALAGTTTEYGVGAYIDLSTENAMATNANMFIDALNMWLSSLDEKPDFLAGNNFLVQKIASTARRAGYYTRSEDAFGRVVDNFNGIALVDLGAKPGSNNLIIPNVTRTISATPVTNLTDLYAGRFGLDGLHGVSLAGTLPGQLPGDPLVQQWLPDFSTAGAVKTGEVELVAAVALKATKAAGVLRNVKVS